MKSIELKTVIERPVSAVWNFVIDPRNTPKWVDSIVVEETNESPISLNTTYRNRGDDVIWTEYAVTELDFGKMFVLTHSDHNFHIRYILNALNGSSCELVYIEWVDEGELEAPSTQPVIDKLKEVIESEL